MSLSDIDLHFPRRDRRFLRSWILALITLALVVLSSIAIMQAATVSNYELAQAQPFNRVETYPAQPLPTSPNLRPIGQWIGRLILPTEQEYAADPGDWVWFEVWHGAEGSPVQVGQVVKLGWRPTEASDLYVKTVTKDITFNQQAENFLAKGNLVPVRLNGRKQVGPLQSLAGARPQDDVTVRLLDVGLVTEGNQVVLQTDLEPIQITGREYGLVKVLGPDTQINASLPKECPGPAPCPTEYFRVQFYNTAAQDFTGPTDTIRIPQQPMANGERFFSNVRALESSPAGIAGWYIYGSRDAKGVFTVQSLKPRALFQLQPDQVVIGHDPGLEYIDRQNWRDTPQRKGTVQRVLVSPNGGAADAARAQWQEEDYALVIHLFGGIGGENQEFTPAGTVTGHFAYGLARVVREPIANELQFAIQYQQIYAHNSGGIVSGTHDWADYMGNMQRGWLGLRPVSDVVVKLDSFIKPLQIGDTNISLFRELLIQAQVMAARYRTGDGTGVAGVTPATSCVQDSNQALFIAMQQVRRQIETNPAVIQWLQQNPNSPEVIHAGQFVALGHDLRALLTPYGVIRPDWQKNAESLAGIVPRGAFTSNRGLFSGVLSWQTMMPRWGHDAVARTFLRNGAQLWFLRTNMVGGNDPRVEPIPPTTLFGGIPILGRAVQRFADAVTRWPTALEWLAGLVGLALYGAWAIPFGRHHGFLVLQNGIDSPIAFVLDLVRLFCLPALGEEIIFRVLLLPYPLEGIPTWQWLLWAIASLGLFILYPLALGKTVYKAANHTLSDRRFLILMTGLGILLTVTYGIIASLWLITFIHWAVVAIWIYAFGGKARLPYGSRKGAKSRLPAPTQTP